MIGKAGQSDHVQEVLGALAAGLHRQAEDLGGQQDIVDDLAPFEQQRLLKHHADITTGPERHILAADADRAFICRQEIGEDLQDRGLAAARRPDEGNELAIVDLHGDIRDGKHFLVAGLVGLADILQLDDAFAHCASSLKAMGAAIGHGRIFSKARAACRTRRSPRGGPTICSPTGRPVSDKPQGTLAAGWRVRLKGKVNPYQDLPS